MLGSCLTFPNGSLFWSSFIAPFVLVAKRHVSSIEPMADSLRKTSRVEAFFINIYNAMLERSELFCKAMEGEQLHHEYPIYEFHPYWPTKWRDRILGMLAEFIGGYLIYFNISGMGSLKSIIQWWNTTTVDWFDYICFWQSFCLLTTRNQHIDFGEPQCKQETSKNGRWNVTSFR